MVSTTNKDLQDPSDDLTEVLVELVADMIACRCRKGQIKTKLAALNNGIKVRREIVEAIITKAKDLLRERVGLTKKDLYNDAFAFYEAIIRDEYASHRDKITAQEAICRLGGIGHQYSAPDNPDEEAGRIRQAIRDMRQSVEGAA